LKTNIRKISNKAIVIGGHTQALGIARSLGRNGISVFLLYDKQLCISRFSRFVSGFIRAPKGTTSYYLNAEQRITLVKFLLELPQQFIGAIIFPTNDSVVEVLSKFKDKLSMRYVIYVPKWKILDNINDKLTTIKIAEQEGIPIPRTVLASNILNLDTCISSINFPVIVKGRKGQVFSPKFGHKAFRVGCEEALHRLLDKIKKHMDLSDVLIQEIINDSDVKVVSFCSIILEKDIVAYWMGEKIREHPMGSGTGTYARSTYIPSLIDKATKLLRRIGYSGISEIEFKLDNKDGKFKFIEINPRTWLWVSLATASGLNFPFLLFKLLSGERYLLKRDYNINIKWIHLIPDFKIFLKGIMTKQIKLKDYLESFTGEKEFAVFSLNDPLPFLAELLLLPYLIHIR
jgi:predicted ATP-grasp superfamily ATP-dependent carboligase